MADDPQRTNKLRLRSTDTNRFKVDTARLRVQPSTPPADEPETAPIDAGQTQKAGDFHNPVSLRDTSTGKLKRLSSSTGSPATINLRDTSTGKLLRQNFQPETPAAGKLRETATNQLQRSDTPAGATASVEPPDERKHETVRLKVMRSTPAASSPIIGGGAQANVSTAGQAITVPKIATPPLAKIAVEAPPKSATASPPVSAPAVTPPAPAVTPPSAPVPPPVAAVPPPAAPAAVDTPTTPAIKINLPPAAQVEQKPAVPTAAAKTVITPPPQTADAPPDATLQTSTIKLSIKKPGVTLPAAGTDAAAAAPVAKPPQPATPATPASSPSQQPVSPALSTANATGLKIRPATGTQTAAPAEASSAGATVKVMPGSIPSKGGKISLEKGTDAQAGEAATDSASATVAVTPPPAASSTGGKSKGLKIRASNASQTVAVTPPSDGTQVVSPVPQQDGAAVQPETAPALKKRSVAAADAGSGLSKLEGISSLVAAIAIGVTLFSLIMALLKQL